MSLAAGHRVAGIILAAGAARRMGRPKATLPLAGRPLLQHAVDAAAASRLDEIVVVLGHAADEVHAAITLPSRATTVVNEVASEGQSTSLARGLDAISADTVAVAVLLGDQPDVSAELIDELIGIFLANEAPVVRPIWRDAGGGRVPGHPVVLARRIWPALRRVSGDRGARDFFAEHPDWVREVDMPGPPPRDIDDPDAYRRAVRKACARDAS